MREYLSWWWETLGWAGVLLYGILFSFWGLVGTVMTESLLLGLIGGVSAILVWFLMMDLWVYRQVKS